MKIDYSIVIPAYNEAERISTTIQSIERYFSERDIAYEIIVINDGSGDETVKVIEKLKPQIGNLILLDNHVNKGKGAVVRQGVLAAKGELILATDADLSTPVSELPKLEAYLDQGFDIAIGSRALAESKVGVSQPLYRILYGKTFNLLVRLLYLPRVHDSQCGFKLFTRNAAHSVFAQQKLAGLVYDVEILYLAKKMGFKIKEVPVKWNNSPDSKFRSSFSNARQVLLDLFAIRTLHKQS